MGRESEYLDDPHNHDEDRDFSGSLVLRARGHHWGNQLGVNF
ncbi:MAG: hypothetical protein VYA05_02265 [Pseudomonadota bacterium]|nr:hypothetical protein [Pseudomonadota bacterium]MEC9299639.1 hypothetical protein [Pseudomonadota bacterium]MED5386959.1 hypothetical protein [Pseudomonadota bacterium]MED5530189.1 hypothetical protein [Pseudomonadota bacterium]